MIYYIKHNYTIYVCKVINYSSIDSLLLLERKI